MKSPSERIYTYMAKRKRDIHIHSERIDRRQTRNRLPPRQLKHIRNYAKLTRAVAPKDKRKHKESSAGAVAERDALNDVYIHTYIVVVRKTGK